MQLLLSGIKKSFGEKEVLKGISLSIDSGSAFGLLGRNGAGKTTLIRIIMDVFPPDEGELFIDGAKIRSSAIKIGYLPEERGMYQKKKINEQLVYLGELKGMSKTDALKEAKYWTERFELGEYFDKKLMTLSKGNQQKIQLIAAIINNPDIIVLDEPFSGLDPVNAQTLKDVVSEKVNEGKLVLFSSHQMNYIEEFCDNLAILNNGQIVLSGNLKEIKKNYNSSLIRINSGNDIALIKQLEDLKKSELKNEISTLSLNSEGIDLSFNGADAKHKILNAVSLSGIDIDSFSVVMPSLEEIFVEKVGENI